LLSWFLTLLSGLLATAAFPPFNLWPVVVLAMIPLFSAIWNREWRDALRTGWVFGLVYFGLLLWWLAPTISRFGNIPIWAACPVIGLLICYLALFPAVWAGTAAYLSCRMKSGIMAGIVLSLLWGALEWLRGWMLSGFPWGTLSYALAPQPLLFQSADLWGPYAMSSVLVFINFLLWDATVNREASGGISMKSLFNGLLITVICGAAAYYGVIRYRAVAASDGGFPEVSTAAVQGALPQEMKWEPGLQRHTVELYQKLTEDAINRLRPAGSRNTGPDILVVWPETAMPFFFQHGGELSEMVRKTARDINGAILFGTPAFKRKTAGRTAYFNRACLIDEKGGNAGCYDKMHLVPFGEYLPWGILTSWAREMVPAAGNFTAGASAAPLQWHDVRIGVMICFESIFPELARKGTAAGANCLAVITNDSWFGDTGAPWQHAAIAAFRAVEQRRWIIRAANTGISEIISPTGQVVAKSSLFRQDTVTSHIRLRDDRTVYQRFGDIPFLLCATAAAVLAFALSRRRNGKVKDDPATVKSE